MRRAVLLLASAGVSLALAATPPARPPITGIDHVAFETTRPVAAARFWTHVVGAQPERDAGVRGGRRFRIDGEQFVELLPVASARPDMLAHIAYRTSDVDAMRRYLIAGGGAAVTRVVRDGDGARWIATHDPEGIEVRFVERRPGDARAVPGVLGDRIIHAGHLVRDRNREDRFYRGRLGFRPYWFGGMRAGTVDWVSQQVPDGRDWFEYMLVPPNAPPPDRRALGGMNHVSLGVRDVRGAMARLAAAGTPIAATAKPLLGRDGKWQANLLDPDGTRVELMDFAPSAPPCCSPFTAANPRP